MNISAVHANDRFANGNDLGRIPKHPSRPSGGASVCSESSRSSVNFSETQLGHELKRLGIQAPKDFEVPCVAPNNKKNMLSRRGSCSGSYVPDKNNKHGGGPNKMMRRKSMGAVGSLVEKAKRHMPPRARSSDGTVKEERQRRASRRSSASHSSSNNNNNSTRSERKVQPRHISIEELASSIPRRPPRRMSMPSYPTSITVEKLASSDEVPDNKKEEDEEPKVEETKDEETNNVKNSSGSIPNNNDHIVEKTQDSSLPAQDDSHHLVTVRDVQEQFRDEGSFTGDDLYISEFGHQLRDIDLSNHHNNNDDPEFGYYRDDFYGNDASSHPSGEEHDLEMTPRSGWSKDPSHANLMQQDELEQFHLWKLQQQGQNRFFWPGRRSRRSLCLGLVLAAMVSVVVLFSSGGKDDANHRNSSDHPFTTTANPPAPATPNPPPGEFDANPPASATPNSPQGGFDSDWTSMPNFANPMQEYVLHTSAQEKNQVSVALPGTVEGLGVLDVHLYVVEPPRPVDDSFCEEAANAADPHYTVELGDTFLHEIPSRDTQIIACVEGSLLGSVMHLFVDAGQSDLTQSHQLQVLDFQDSFQEEVRFEEKEDSSERLYLLILDAAGPSNAYYVEGPEAIDTFTNRLRDHPEDLQSCHQTANGLEDGMVSSSFVHSQDTQGPDSAPYILWDLTDQRPKDQESWSALVYTCNSETDVMEPPALVTVVSPDSSGRL